MARIRSFTDEHVARAVVIGLRRRGVDVLTVPEAGTLGASDAEQLQRASDEERVIFTQDDDFLRLEAAGTDHAGIVYASQERSPLDGDSWRAEGRRDGGSAAYL